MDKKEEFIKVGKYDNVFNEILGVDILDYDIYISKGLSAHMIKRKHYNCLKYIDNISDIILHPDYIGINPNESGQSIELIKKYEDNVLVGIKLDTNQNYMYVSTMHDIQESKISRRIHSGRLKKIPIDIKTSK